MFDLIYCALSYKICLQKLCTIQVLVVYLYTKITEANLSIFVYRLSSVIFVYKAHH